MSSGPVRPSEILEGQPTAEQIQAELDRLLASDQFKNSKRCRTLLSHLVEETLAGHTDQLKERLVGASAFGRELNYDTAEDPVVRNAAIEVRKRLAQFYIDAGSDSPVRIDLHAGTYIPEFRSTLPAPSPALPAAPEPDSTPAPFSARRKILLISASVAALALLILVAFLAERHFNRPQEAVQPPSASGAAAQVVEGEAIRILAGDMRPGPYVDRFGNQWLPDRYFSGGTAQNGVTTFFFPPADPELFRNMRFGASAYDIPLKPGQSYELRLYFAEPNLRYGNEITGDGEGTRTFQIFANDRILINYFDIISDAGFASTTVRSFKDITAAADGKLHLRFGHQQSEPLVNAIELLPTAPHTIQPIRIHAGQFNYRDQAGNRWSPDNFFIGGSQFDARVPAAGSSDPDLFKVERVGNFHYAIPVPPGHYSLTLYFAETWFHEPGQRVFDVTCNGVTLLHHLDIIQAVGFSHVYQKTFRGLEPNGQGKLLIGFSPAANYGSIRAIEVVDEGR